VISSAPHRPASQPDDGGNDVTAAPVNVAVVGCGYWGPNLVRNFLSLSDCRVLQACDCCPERLQHMQGLYPQVQATICFDDVVRDERVDAVAIATPVRWHFEMAKRCLEAGKHVFIEKPMAASVAECRMLLKIAEARQRVIFVGHTFIYSPAVRRIREIIQAGELGEIQYISARRLNLGLFQKDINVAWDLAPHDISIILYALKKRPVAVNCQGKAHVHPQIEDVTSMTLHFDNGGLATIQSSWLDPNKVRDMTFVGSRKMLLYNDLEPNEKIKIYDKRVERPPHYDTFAEFHFSYHYGDMYSPYLRQYEPLRMQCQHFLDCLRTGDTPETSGYDGLQVVEILEAATCSLRQKGAEIDLGRGAVGGDATTFQADG
jgi:predicted dehydrogenase